MYRNLDRIVFDLVMRNCSYEDGVMMRSRVIYYSIIIII